MSFPALYQAHHQHYQDDIYFWLDLASRTSGPILEAGCGTGRVLIPLAEAGSTCIGIDIDFGMLKLLKQHLPKNLASSIRYIQTDFANFHLGMNFALILLTCNTYTTLDQSQRLKTLACIRRHLLPGGRFAVSVPNPEVLRKLPRNSSAQIEEIFTHPHDGEPVQVSSEWHRDQSELRIKWHYDHLLSNGTVKRVSVETIQYLTSYEQLTDELRSSYFEIDQTWGDFDHSDYYTDSPQLIIQASRRTI